MKKILKNRDFLLLWLGQTVSGFGTWINFVGLNLYVLYLTGSGKVLGLFLVVRMLPSLLFGSLGGWLADRYPRRTIMIACDIVRAGLVLGFVFTQNIWAFYILGMILSAVDKIFMSAQGAYLPNIVEKEDLLEANSIVRMTTSVIMVLGPAAGALMVSHYPYKLVFIVDSITFVVSVACVAFITRAGMVKSKGKTPGVIEEFKAAFSFFRAQTGILFLAVVRLIDALGSGSYNTALPIFSRAFALGKGSAYGWLVGAWALGQFVGSLSINYVSKKITVSREKVFSLSVLIMAAGMGLTFHTGNLWYAMSAIFFGGLGDGVSNVLFNTVLMKETPDEIRGKVFGSTIALTYTIVALGMGGAGFMIDKYPLNYTTDFCTGFIIIGVMAGYALFVFFSKKNAGRGGPPLSVRNVR